MFVFLKSKDHQNNWVLGLVFNSEFSSQKLKSLIAFSKLKAVKQRNLICVMKTNAALTGFSQWSVETGTAA